MPQHPGRPQVAFLVCETLRFSPGHRGRGVEKLTKNMTFEKMAAIGSGASSFHPRQDHRVRIRRQDPQDMGRGIGHVQGDAGRPQVPFSLSPAHRGRGVDSGGERRRVVPVKLTFEKMAAVQYIASVSILRIPPCLSVGRATARSGCGTWERARSSRSSRATGDSSLRKVASLPR